VAGYPIIRTCTPESALIAQTKPADNLVGELLAGGPYAPLFLALAVTHDRLVAAVRNFPRRDRGTVREDRPSWDVG
jgi:hypothetical protein